MSFFSKKVRLSESEGVVKVELVARVASANVLTSPLTGFPAALIHFTVVARRTSAGPAGKNDPFWGYQGSRLQVVGSTIVGAVVDLDALDDGAHIRVATQSLTVKPCADLDTASLLETRVPEALERLVALAAQYDGTVCVREAAFRHGDRVRLRAHVAKAAEVIATEYRSTTSTLWIARPDLGAVELDELV